MNVAATNLKRTPVARGWAKTSVNTPIFRSRALTTFNNYQYLAFYDEEARVILARRDLETENWQIHPTQYTGNVKDAHNVISIIVDGEGYLHVSWDHHNHPLNYCRSLQPESLELSNPLFMTGILEDKVTYPQFYRLTNGNLLFFYRDGSSGNGDLHFNHYDTQTQRWTKPIERLIDGENERNPYWQLCTDSLGTIHLSWVWRETPDVVTNHDICYAKSFDGGLSWLKADGSQYQLPITRARAEVACHVPQNSKLANQTSMCADKQGRPYIVNFWQKETDAAPQYHLVFYDGQNWNTEQVSDRKTNFDLQGRGTKKVPISRPQIAVDAGYEKTRAYLIYRDNERGGGITLSSCDDLAKAKWKTTDLVKESLGDWEPCYDLELWQEQKKLHLFVQRVGQGDGETLEELEAQLIEVLEWIPD